jgi:general secretion pathway protein D
MPIVHFVPWVFGLFMGIGTFLPVDLAADARAQETPAIPSPPSSSSKPESVKPSTGGVVTPSQEKQANPSLPAPSQLPEPPKPSKEEIPSSSQEQPANPSLPSPPPTPTLPKPTKDRLITLDFNNVDLPVFVKFVSEIIGKNFIIDERVRGKVTIFSPSKISVDKVYQVFQSVMEIKGLTAVPAGEMIQILPASEVPPERDINVYYLENANAEEAAKLLTSLATRTAAPPVPGRPAGKSPGEFEGTVQIIPDKATNALLITASPKDYEMLKEVIKKIDVRRRQVYVEAVIMEVAQDKLRQLGTQLGALGGYQTNNQNVTIYGSANEDLSELANLTNITGVAGGTGGGLNLALSTVNVKILLSALESATDTNVLSTPQILTTNNQKAKIVVAQNVPFITGNNQTVGGVTQTQITRQDVGVTLELTPEILEGDRVRMDVRQEISSLADTPQAVLIQLGPTTNKREATTTVIVDNHQTVVIGGLMRDDINNTTTKIPLLGDIPLIGWLFKYQSKHVTKANLLIFLTPHVVHDNNDLDSLRQQKTEYMKTHLVKEALRDQTLTGEFLNSINPPQNKR